MSGQQPANSLRGYVLLSVVWLAILGLALFFLRRPAIEPIEILPPPSPSPTPAPSPAPTPAPIHVDVAGAVVAPGVYSLSPGSIAADAIAAAGGPAPGADLDRVNKAARAVDGTQIYVPHQGEPASPLTSAGRSGGAGGAIDQASQGSVIVDINNASREALEGLPGIGPELAQRIIAGRPYSTVDDLNRVPGIGQATLDKLKDRVIVR